MMSYFLRPIIGVTNVVLLLCLGLLAGCSGKDIDHKKIVIIFRYDDYSNSSPTGLEKKLIDAFRKSGLTITFAVIPYSLVADHYNRSNENIVCLDNQKADLIMAGLRDNTVNIAQHGFSHQKSRASRIDSEFIGMPFEEQVKKISDGSEVLYRALGRRVRVFAPPWNKYDLLTIKALEQLGFITLSAGLGGPSKLESKLKFLPATCEICGLRDAVECARKSREPRPIIVCLFHGYDFYEIDKQKGCTEFDGFLKLIQWIRSQRDIEVLSLEDAARSTQDLGPDRYSINKRCYRIVELIPEDFRHFLPINGVYVSSGISCLRSICYVAVCYLIIFTVPFVISLSGYQAALKDRLKVGLPIGLASLLLLFIILAYALRRGELSTKGALIIAIFSGFSGGIWVAYLRGRRKVLRLTDRGGERPRDER
jgi:peptidoglycan/xylan/chitin deacetylase (PgdA/CDA1 family)